MPTDAYPFYTVQTWEAVPNCDIYSWLEQDKEENTAKLG